MNRRTIFLILLLFLASGLIILVSRELPNKPTSKTPSPTAVPTPATRNFTTLVASPSASLVLVGEEASFVVIVDTGGNNVASVQLEMLFNPEYIKVSGIEPLTFFNDPTILLREIDNKAGVISYALGSTTQARSGRGALVKITLVGKKSTSNNSTPITFLPKTAVGEIGTLVSVLKETLGANFIIQ